MVAGRKGLAKEVMDGLEMLVDGEVAEVCRQAEQILLQGGDSGGEVDLDPAVRQVVFALITLVRPNKSSFTLPFKKCNYEVIIEKWMTLCPRKNNRSALKVACSPARRLGEGFTKKVAVL